MDMHKSHTKINSSHEVNMTSLQKIVNRTEQLIMEYLALHSPPPPPPPFPFRTLFLTHDIL